MNRLLKSVTSWDRQSLSVSKFHLLLRAEIDFQPEDASRCLAKEIRPASTVAARLFLTRNMHLILQHPKKVSRFLEFQESVPTSIAIILKAQIENNQCGVFVGNGKLLVTSCIYYYIIFQNVCP